MRYIKINLLIVLALSLNIKILSSGAIKYNNPKDINTISADMMKALEEGMKKYKDYVKRINKGIVAVSTMHNCLPKATEADPASIRWINIFRDSIALTSLSVKADIESDNSTIRSLQSYYENAKKLISTKYTNSNEKKSFKKDVSNFSTAIALVSDNIRVATKFLNDLERLGIEISKKSDELQKQLTPDQKKQLEIYEKENMPVSQPQFITCIYNVMTNLKIKDPKDNKFVFYPASSIQK